MPGGEAGRAGWSFSHWVARRTAISGRCTLSWRISKALSGRSRSDSRENRICSCLAGGSGLLNTACSTKLNKVGEAPGETSTCNRSRGSLTSPKRHANGTDQVVEKLGLSNGMGHRSPGRSDQEPERCRCSHKEK